MHILIIDDEASIRNSLRDVLEFEDHEISEAKDGKEALAQVSEIAFDLILCDIKMPNMDGFEFLSKARLSGLEVPIIMMSGHACDKDGNRCLNSGANAYISKPFDLGLLLDMLDKYML